MNKKKAIPLVSICIQTYQHAPYIRQAIESTLSQHTDFPFEINLGEDNSTDGTREICIEYAKKYPTIIKLFLNDRKNVIYINGHPTGRWNFMNNIKNARGKYIALLPGDDFWTDSYKLQKQVDFLDSHPTYAGCFHDTMLINGHKKKPWRQYDRVDFNLLDTFSTLALFHPSSFLFQRQYLELPDWFREVVSGDMALFSLIASKGPLKRLPETMSVYRKHEGGITNNKKLIENYHQGRIHLMKCLDKHFMGKHRDIIEAVIKFHEQAYELSKIDHNNLWYEPKKNFLSLTRRIFRFVKHINSKI